MRTPKELGVEVLSADVRGASMTPATLQSDQEAVRRALEDAHFAAVERELERDGQAGSDDPEDGKEMS